MYSCGIGCFWYISYNFQQNKSHTTMWSSGVLTGSSRNYPIWSQNCMISNKTSRNVKGALHDTGKYSLAAQAAILKVSHQTWTQLTPEQRSRRLLKLLNFIHKQTDCQTSTDGHLTIPAVSRVAQKPGQRKRFKICKTQSIDSKKPRLT
jgi:hypothetical protein